MASARGFGNPPRSDVARWNEWFRRRQTDDCSTRHRLRAATNIREPSGIVCRHPVQRRSKNRQQQEERFRGTPAEAGNGNLVSKMLTRLPPRCHVRLVAFELTDQRLAHKFDPHIGRELGKPNKRGVILRESVGQREGRRAGGWGTGKMGIEQTRQEEKKQNR